MGGWIAGRFFEEHPDLCKRLILCAPAIVPPPMPFLGQLLIAPLGVGNFLFWAFGKNGLLKELKKTRFSNEFSRPEEYKDIIDSLVKKVEWQIEKKDGFLQAFHSTLKNLPKDYQALKSFKEAICDSDGKPTIPVLLIWGKKDEVMPFILHDRIPFTTLVELDSSGHAMFFESFEEVKTGILDFLVSN